MQLHFFRALASIVNSTRIGAIECVARFGRNSSGNIAVLFGIVLVPLLIAVGCAIDYSVANNQRTKMQSALDAAILAGSIAGKQALDSGANSTAAIAAANAAAANFFSANIPSGISASISTNFTMDGLTLAGKGTATGTVFNSFMKVAGHPTTQLSTASQSSSTAQPYLNVYLLIDISASMLLPSTSAGITQMMNGQGGCALACHDKANGTDSYAWAQKKGIELRYQVVNQGVQNLLTYLNSNANLKSHVKVGLWSFDDNLSQLTAPTYTYSMVSSSFPAPALANTDASAATPFNSLISKFISDVGPAGDGSSASSPQKMVIIATDGVNDPTRAWVSEPSLRSQVKVFDTAFCSTFKSKGVTVAIINTPYYPMTWDWGYNATLGQPGSLGGATRVDDIPIALSACAGKYFTVASDVASIQSAFTKLFVAASPIRLTN
ncbi:TadE/TadG family type IV pilus assembly protein [Leptospira interrogans]